MSYLIFLDIIALYYFLINVINALYHIDTVEVVGSSPIAPTRNIKGLQHSLQTLFLFFWF